MRLFRVLPHVASARTGSSGHPSFVPEIQGAGRIDNPVLYRVLYLSDAAEGAAAERFGNLSTWLDAMLTPPPSLPEARWSLVEYAAPSSIRLLDLDAPEELVARGLRPSRVISRDRSATQAWAARVFDERRWSGVRWWSYWDSRWGSVGLWKRANLRMVSVSALHREHPALIEAGRVLAKPWR